MISENGFFRVDDIQAEEIGGVQINQNWWSRKYEYPWAFGYAGRGMHVADMGCGYTYRPFKDALARVCEKVYAVDGDDRVLGLVMPERVELVVADFTERVEEIPEGSLDRVFCISVLEDVGNRAGRALAEFFRCLKPNGLAVLTFDVQYDPLKPLGQYRGVRLDRFMRLVMESGFLFGSPVSLDRTNVIFNEEFNLCVYHCVLRKL